MKMTFSIRQRDENILPKTTIEVDNRNTISDRNNIGTQRIKEDG